MKNCLAAGEALATAQEAGLDAPIPREEDARLKRLRFEPAPGVDLRDRFRGGLVGGAIGHAMGRPNEGVPAAVARERRMRDYSALRAQGSPTSATRSKPRH